MATFSPLKPSAEPRRFTSPLAGTPQGAPKRRRRWILPVGALIVVAAILGAGAIVLVSAKASIETDPAGLAKVGLPLGGGKIESVSVIGGRERKLVGAKVAGGGTEIVARRPVPADDALKLRVVIRRPGWVSWLTGKTQVLTLAYTTPTASSETHYLTLHKGSALKLRFKAPVGAYEYGSSPRHLTRKVLRKPQSVVTLPHNGPAGSLYVAAQIHTWESSSAARFSYFPGGSTASAVTEPRPGTTITPTTPITISFSKPISKVLGSHMPSLSPATTGSWQRVTSHEIRFVPSGYGYGLDATVQIAMPSGVRLLGGKSGTATSGSWAVPGGSIIRAQQILAKLGYLPMNFNYAGNGPGTTPSDQVDAAVHPPAGKFSWTYANTPSMLKDQFKPGGTGVVMQGAIETFEDQHGMTADGLLGPTMWKALMAAAVKGQKNTAGYTFVMVSEGSPESLTLWHNGKNAISNTPVNTGVAGAETAQGTYPVFEHLPVTTMTGTNVDGSKYVDPGIQWVSYFNGGDALHGFVRASYGFPQSNGCVEMPVSVAAQVYPYTPIGTLVDVY